MLEKYVEEKFPRWFEFGNHGNGMVDIASMQDDTIVTIPNYYAKKLISIRDESVDMIARLADALDKADHETFVKIWYN